MKEASAHLYALGLGDDFYFYGGAVRDHFLRVTHNDIDVTCIFPGYDPFWASVQAEAVKIPKSSILNIRNLFTTKKLRNMFDKKGIEFESLENMEDSISIRLNFTDSVGVEQKLDLRLVKDKHPMENCRFEAPINSMMIDKGGNLYGQEQALDHAGNGIFCPRSDFTLAESLKARIRYGKIKQRLGDALTYQPSEEGGGISSLWHNVVKMTDIPNKVLATIHEAKQKIYELS